MTAKPRPGTRREAAEVVRALTKTVGLDRAAELLRATDHLHVRVSAIRLERYRDAATRAGLSLSRWALGVLDRACDAER